MLRAARLAATGGGHRAVVGRAAIMRMRAAAGRPRMSTLAVPGSTFGSGPQASLVLEDGSRFTGVSFGYETRAFRVRERASPPDPNCADGRTRRLQQLGSSLR